MQANPPLYYRILVAMLNTMSTVRVYRAHPLRRTKAGVCRHHNAPSHRLCHHEGLISLMIESHIRWCHCHLHLTRLNVRFGRYQTTLSKTRLITNISACHAVTPPPRRTRTIRQELSRTRRSLQSLMCHHRMTRLLLRPRRHLRRPQILGSRHPNHLSYKIR